MEIAACRADPFAVADIAVQGADAVAARPVEVAVQVEPLSIRDARKQLRGAYTLFSAVGMEAFAERARAELRATGAQVLKRTAGTGDVLTAQEALIARLASQGASNAQIAAQLFISPATVAYHLGKVFAKLGISSRGQLARALPAGQAGVHGAP